MRHKKYISNVLIDCHSSVLEDGSALPMITRSKVRTRSPDFKTASSSSAPNGRGLHLQREQLKLYFGVTVLLVRTFQYWGSVVPIDVGVVTTMVATQGSALSAQTCSSPDPGHVIGSSHFHPISLT